MVFCDKGFQPTAPLGDPVLSEGLMLKRLDSAYEAGRPKGPWFKWKRDPRLIDAVVTRRLRLSR